MKIEIERATVQQALEALEPLSAYGRVGSRDVEQAAAQVAISALREALAAPQPAQDATIIALRAALAEPVVEQSPVEKDAARYRWLRNLDREDFAFAVVKNPHFDIYESAQELDADIDSAMKESK